MINKVIDPFAFDNAVFKLKTNIAVEMACFQAQAVAARAKKENLVEEFKKAKFYNDNSIVINNNVVNKNIGKTALIDIDQIINEVKKTIKAQDDTVDIVIEQIYRNAKITETGNEELIKAGKANILLSGPTGTGKSEILSLVCNQILPTSIMDIKQTDLTNAFVSLLTFARGDLELAQRGIIVINSFDILTNSEYDCEKHFNKYCKKAIQQELLKYMSGCKIKILYQGEEIIFDTSKITFVAIGDFNNLRKRKMVQIEKMLAHYPTSVYYYPPIEILTQEDYIGEDLEDELIRNFTLLTSTKSLDVEDLERILNESDTSPLKELQRFGEYKGVNISYDSEFVHTVATMAYVDGFGVKSLRKIVDDLEDFLLERILSGRHYITLTDTMLEKFSSKNKRMFYLMESAASMGKTDESIRKRYR